MSGAYGWVVQASIYFMRTYIKQEHTYDASCGSWTTRWDRLQRQAHRSTRENTAFTRHASNNNKKGSFASVRLFPCIEISQKANVSVLSGRPYEQRFLKETIFNWDEIAFAVLKVDLNSQSTRHQRSQRQGEKIIV